MEVGDVTCLVGRKDGGKAALLKACIDQSIIDALFDVTDNYPLTRQEGSNDRS